MGFWTLPTQFPERRRIFLKMDPFKSACEKMLRFMPN
jgi:hypothetical protein